MRLRVIESPPPPDLAAFVECLWSLDSATMDRGIPLYPDGRMELLAPYLGEVAGGSPLVIGQCTRPLILHTTPVVGIVGARFRPVGARAAFGGALESLVDRSVALEHLWGTTAGRLGASVRAAASAEEASCRLVDLLRDQVRGDSRTATIADLAASRIADTAGRVEVDQLAAQLDTSPRQLRRVFRREVGIPPKLLCRIVRFRRTFAALDCSGDGARVAAGAGYFDQSHWCRDIRQFCGASARQFATLWRTIEIEMHRSTQEPVRSFQDDHVVDLLASRPCSPDGW